MGTNGIVIQPDDIHVVCGVLLNRETGHVFMGLRRSEAIRPSLWEFPGGKVDAGEDPRAALRREWREELAIDTVVGSLVSRARFELERTYVADLYAIHRADTRHPQALDHDDLAWVELGYAVKHMPCSPGFYLHYQDVLKWVTEQVKCWAPVLAGAR